MKVGELLIYALAVLFIAVGLFNFVLKGELTSQALGLLVVAAVMFALPMAQRLKVTHGGIEYERIKEEREKTELAANVARVYFSLLLAMTGRIFMTPSIMRHLIQLIHRSIETRATMTLQDVVGAFEKGSGEPYPEDRAPELAEVYLDLEREGLLNVSGEGPDVRAEVVPELREAVLAAFSHYEGR